MPANSPFPRRAGARQHTVGHGRDLGADQGRRRDRVVPGLQRRQHVEVHRERQRAGVEALQQVQHRHVRLSDLLPEPRVRLVVVADEREHVRLLRGVFGVGGHGLDVRAGGGGLQLDAGAEDPEQRRRLVERQVGVHAGRGHDREVHARVQVEPVHDPADQLQAVARQHARGDHPER